MNDNYSGAESKYRPRWLADVLRKAADESPVVVLTGARQVGKSTLLKNEVPFAGWTYHSLDDFDVLEQAQKDPQTLWAGAEKIVLDEVQKAPKLLDAVKLTVDRAPEARRFVLTGSANLLLMRDVSESLAGRALYLALLPTTLGEQMETPAPTMLKELLDGDLPEEGSARVIDPLPLMQRGFMPALMRVGQGEAATRWWEGYTTTYLERDLRQLSQVESLPDFRRVMEVLALRTGTLVNQSEVARDAGVSQPTVHRYLNLLETSHLVLRVPAFTRSRTSRLTKSPKLYWADPGLASFLAGHFDSESLKDSREAGGMFECLVLMHIRALCQLLAPRPRIYYWRTTTGKEVDFVIEQGQKTLAIEVKLTTRPHYRDAENLRFFLERHPSAKAGVVIHAGPDLRYLGERVVALPWTCVASG